MAYMADTADIPAQYATLSQCRTPKDSTAFVGLVVDGVLDETVLAAKVDELFERWPLLKGRLLTNVSLNRYYVP